MQSDSNRITEEELDAILWKVERMNEDPSGEWMHGVEGKQLAYGVINTVPFLIAEVRRLRAEMPTAVYRMAPGERKEIITSEHFTIYMKQTPPPPLPEMDEVDKLEAAILARWANEAGDKT